MKEIKFRAWNKANNKWEIFTNVRIELDGGVLHSHYDKDQVEYFRNCPDIEIMQYTGLKDKNGKEIYEGDIVKSLHGYKNNKPLVVVFEHGCFFLRNEKIASATSFEDLLLQDFEVIGNMYENPELLK